MITAYKLTNYVLAYHSGNKFQWSMQLNSNGSSGGGGGGGGGSASGLSVQ